MSSLYKDTDDARILYKSCPLCESTNFTKSLRGDCSKHPLYNPIVSRTMQWMECKDCKHEFIDGYFTEETCEMIFSKVQAIQKVGFQIEKQRVVSAKIVEKVLDFKSSGTWVDIGFGSGSLIFTAEEYGFQLIGIDLRKENVELMKELGFEVYCNFVENINFKKKIAVASMMDVLEHMPYPKKVLSHLYPKMEDDGCLIISMPNKENIVWKLMNQNNQNPYLGELEHYHNFSRTRLFSLLEECGFSAVRYGVSERYRVCMEITAIRG